MSDAPPLARKRCTVVYALRERQWLWEVQIDAGADVGAVISAARASAQQELHAGFAIPWDDAPVGIFGERCTRAAVPRDGDRIELYRPLTMDPKVERRERARRGR